MFSVVAKRVRFVWLNMDVVKKGAILAKSKKEKTGKEFLDELKTKLLRDPEAGLGLADKDRLDDCVNGYIQKYYSAISLCMQIDPGFEKAYSEGKLGPDDFSRVLETFSIAPKEKKAIKFAADYPDADTYFGLSGEETEICAFSGGIPELKDVEALIRNRIAAEQAEERKKAEKEEEKRVRAENNSDADPNDPAYGLGVEILNIWECKSRIPKVKDAAQLNTLLQSYTPEESLTAAEKTRMTPGFQRLERYLRFSTKSAPSAGSGTDGAEVRKEKPDTASAERHRLQVTDAERKRAGERLQQELKALAANSRHAAQKRVMESIDEFCRSKYKYTLLDVIVSGGKTHMSAMIALYCRAMGFRYVFSSPNKDILITGIQQLARQYPDQFEWGRNAVYVPSLQNAYNHFFDVHAVPRDESEDEMLEATAETKLENYMPEITDEIRNDLNAYIRACIENANSKKLGLEAEEKSLETRHDAKKMSDTEYAEKSRELGKKLRDAREFLNTSKKALEAVRNMHETLKDCAEEKDMKIREEKDLEFASREMEIRKFLNICCESDFKKSGTAMAEKYPFVSLLYPGVLYATADAVYCTYAKLSRDMIVIGRDSSGSVINPGPGSSKAVAQRPTVVFLDESDQFCSAALDSILDDAVDKVCDLVPFISLFYDNMRDYLDDKEQAVILEHERITEQDEKALYPELRKIIDEIAEMYDDYGISHITTFGYDDAGDSLPILTRGSDGLQVISPRGEKDKENIWNGLAVNGHKRRIICKKTSDPSRKRIETFASSMAVTIDHIISFYRNVSRVICKAVKDISEKDSVESAARYFRMDQYKDFLYHNVYAPKGKTVRSGSGPYARGNSLIMAEDSPHNCMQTALTYSVASKLPDYQLANLIINNDKTILSSGTARLASLNNADLAYLRQAVSDHIVDEMDTALKYIAENKDSDDLDKINSCKTLEKMLEETDPEIVEYDISDATKAVTETRRRWEREILEGHEGVFPIYDEGSKPKSYPEDYIRDQQYYRDATGLPEAPRFEFDENDNRKVKRGDLYVALCNAAFALDSMIQRGCHTGLFYRTALPGESGDKKPYYNTAEFTIIADAVALKHGLPKGKVQLRSLRVSNCSVELARLEKGIREDEYILYCTSEKSISAGTDGRYTLADEQGVPAGPYFDLDAVFVSKPTNNLPGPGGNEDAKEKRKLLLEDGYLLDKYSNIRQLSRHGRNAMTRYKKYKVFPSILRNSPLFEREPFPGDSLSPLKANVLQYLIQVTGRINRGNKKHGVWMIGTTTGLIDAVPSDLSVLDGIPLTVSLERWLQHISSYKEQREQGRIKKLTYEQQRHLTAYAANNLKNLKSREQFLSRMANEKSNNGVFPATRDEWRYIQEAAFRMGWSGSWEQICGAYYTGVQTADGYRVTLPYPDDFNDSDSHKLASAELVCDPDIDGISCADRHLRALNWYIRNKYFGRGWEDIFRPLLDEKGEIREEILKNGFKYPPYAETYFIFYGIFYERILEAMMLPGGAMDLSEYGLYLAELPLKNFEDGDFGIEWNGNGQKVPLNVLIDVKAYSGYRSPATIAKIKEKYSRLKPGGAFVFINVQLQDGLVEPNRSSQIDGIDVYYVPGIACRSEPLEETRKKLEIRKSGLVQFLLEH